MSLTLSQAVYDAMVRTAREAAPLEACGLLGGTDGRATQFYKLTNTDASAEHYGMKPEEQFAAVKDMRSRGLRMLAIWHSHPASPPRMSQEDLKLAFTPDVIYVIVSLASAAGPTVGAFQVDKQQVTEVKVVIAHE